MHNAAGRIGVSFDSVQLASRQGCPAFSHHGVHLPTLLKWFQDQDENRRKEAEWFAWLRAHPKYEAQIARLRRRMIAAGEIEPLPVEEAQ